MKYSAKCHCSEITVEMEHDPMMQKMMTLALKKDCKKSKKRPMVDY